MDANRNNTWLGALGGGLFGALVLTAAHQLLKRQAPSIAPRMDIFGERAVRAGLKSLGYRPPRGQALTRAALAGDIVTNSLYYSLAGGQHPFTRGALLGVIAGAGAVFLPPLLGLGRAPRGLRRETKLMTAGLYLAGGLASAAAARLFAARRGSRIASHRRAQANGLVS
jgi:hypothetical protein